MQIDGKPHRIGKRIAEVCALSGRAVKRRAELAAFIPPADSADTLTVAIYLYLVRLAVLSGISAPGRWATPQLLNERRDIWLIGNVTRMRSMFLKRLVLDGRPITEKICCSWCTNSAGRGRLASVGDPKQPSLCLFGIDAVSKGAVSDAVDSRSPPFAVVIDALGIGSGRELSRQVERLRYASTGAPLIALGALGDKATILEARRAQVPVWLLRAGDAARLDRIEAEHFIALGPMALSRWGGSDLTSSRLTAGIDVELGILQAPAAQRVFSPLLHAVEYLEGVAGDQQELVSQARGLVRAVIALCVPWKIHVDAVANNGRTGRFATLSLEGRLRALRKSATHTGDTAAALARVLDHAQGVFDVLSAANCVTAKQAALLHAASTAQASRKGLEIVCANESTRRAVQRHLSDAHIDVFTGCVSAVTRSQLMRMVASGRSEAPDLLLLEPLGFGDGIYFSGISPRVRIHAYEFERGALEKQLRHIAHDTQYTSVLRGDKYRYATGEACIPVDSAVEDAEPLWQMHHLALAEPGVWPGKLPEVERFNIPSSDWLQAALESSAEDNTETTEVEIQNDINYAAHAATASGPRVRIELDDNETFLMSPDAPVVLLDDITGSVPAALSARDVQVGMKVLIPRPAHCRSFLDRVIEQCELPATLKLAKDLSGIWQETLAELDERSEGSGTKALAQLLDYGVGVKTAQSVRRWMLGSVVGPRNVESVRAVGLLTQRAELMLLSKGVYDALGDMRKLYVSIFRKAREHVIAGNSLGADEVIDEALGLRRSDLQEFASAGKVTQVDTVASE
jgi:hypothetical protein